MTDVGNRIKERRMQLGLTQQELANKVGYTSKSAIANLENKRDMPMKKLKPIADALNISVWDLMGWEGDSNRFAHIDTKAVANLMLDPTNKDLIDLINRMDPSQKEELRDYATFLLNKKRG